MWGDLLDGVSDSNLCAWIRCRSHVTLPSENLPCERRRQASSTGVLASSMQAKERLRNQMERLPDGGNKLRYLHGHALLALQCALGRQRSSERKARNFRFRLVCGPGPANHRHPAATS